MRGEQFSLARRVIMVIEDSTKRIEGLCALSQALAQARQWEAAREVVTAIEDKKVLNTALKALAQALIQASEWQLARETFTTIEDSIEKAQELSAYGAVLAQASDLSDALQIWREALRILNVFLGKGDTGTVIGELAQALLRNGEVEAIQLWLELKEAITTLEDRMMRDFALYQFCQPLIQLNAWPQVMEVIDTMQTTLFVIKTFSESGQGLVAFSEERMQAGKEEEAAAIRDMAAQIWQATHEAIATLEIGPGKALALNTFGEALMQAHQEQEALQAWHESRDILLSKDGGFWHSGALTALSKLFAQAGHGEEVLALFSIIEESEKREKEYYGLLAILLETQQWQLAQHVIHTIQISPERAWAFRDTYQALIQAREWQQALEVIEELRQGRKLYSYDDAGILQELHKVLTQASDSQEAARLWQEMQGILATITTRDNDQVSAALRELSEALAEREQWQAARDLIASIDGYTEEAVAAREFCQMLARAHRWQEAREVAASIQKDSEQIRALSELGLALVAAEQREEAAQAWQAALQAMSQITSYMQSAPALRSLCLGLAQSCQWNDAIQIIHMIEDPKEKAGALSDLGRERALSGNEDMAATAWQVARSIGGDISYPSWRVDAWSELGRAMAQARHEQEAQEAWQEAQKALASIESSYWQGQKTDALARMMIQTGQWRAARDMLVSAAVNTDTNKALGELGTSLIQTHQLQEAQEVLTTMTAGSWYANQLAGELSRAWSQQGNFQEARAALDTIRDNSRRIRALSEFGQALAQAHHEPEALQIWQEIRDLLTIIEDSTQKPKLVSQRVEELGILGHMLAQANHEQEALQIWQEAREILQALADSSRKAEGLSKLGQVMAQANYKQEALQVWQEAQAIISTIKEYSERVNILSALGRTMAQASLESEAWQIWQEALALVTSTDERIVGVINSLDEIDIGQEQQGQKFLATQESYLEGARALRKLCQQLAVDYQRQDRQEEMSAYAEAMEMVVGSFYDQEESEHAGMHNFGRAVSTMMLGFASNSVSAEALSKFSQALAEAGHWQEAHEVLMIIEDHATWRDEAWLALARSLARSERWQEACDATIPIEDSEKRTTMLKGMVKVLAQQKQWQLAWNILATIEDGEARTEALRELSHAVTQFCDEVHTESMLVARKARQEQDNSPERQQQLKESLRGEDYLQLLTALRQVWPALTTSAEALAALPLAHGFVLRSPELGKALAQGFTWADDLLVAG